MKQKINYVVKFLKTQFDIPVQIAKTLVTETVIKNYPLQSSLDYLAASVAENYFLESEY